MKWPISKPRRGGIIYNQKWLPSPSLWWFMNKVGTREPAKLPPGSREKLLLVDLRGGLGNQMLSMVSSEVVAETQGRHPVFMVRGANSTVLDSVAAFGFGLEGTPDFEARFPIAVWYRIKRRLRTILGWDSPFAWRLRGHFLGQFLLSGGVDEWTLPARAMTRRTVTVAGFFCDCPFSMLGREFLTRYFNLGVHRLSSWSTAALAEIRSAEPIALHIRAKDYRKIPGAIQGKSFVEVALHQATRGDGTRTVWVFSDEPDFARALLDPIQTKVSMTFVDPPEGSSAAEQMFLMSMCPTIIGANSTFSFWAIHLAGEQTECLVPATNILDPYSDCAHVERVEPR